MKKSILINTSSSAPATSDSPRVVNVSDLGTLCWTFINETQTVCGNLGITQGSIASSLAYADSLQNMTIYNFLQYCSTLEQAIDFEITQTKVFNVYYPRKGIVQNGIVFQEFANLDHLDWNWDFTDPCNQAIVEGRGFGPTMPVSVVDNAPLEASYTIQQDYVQAKHTKDVSILTVLGNRKIVTNGLAVQQYTLYQIPGTTPDFTSVSVGDWVQVIHQTGFPQLSNSLRIYQIQGSFKDGEEEVQYLVQNA